MKTKNSHNNIIVNLFIPYLVLIVVTLFIIAFAFTKVYWWNSDNAMNYSSGWKYNDGTSADLTAISDDVSFYNTLPELKNFDVLFFRAKNVIVSVYIDGELIVDYNTIEMTPNLHYKAPGIYYPRVELLPEYSHKPIELRVTSPYKQDSSCNLKYLCIGNSEEIFQSEVAKRLPSFCICIVIIAMGIVFILVSRSFKSHDINNRSLTYLGTFATVTGLWALMETSLLQLLFGHSTFWHLITGLTLPLIIAPIFFFFKRRYKSTELFPVVIENIMTIAVYITSLILHFTGIVDLHELISLAHLLIISGALFTIYYAIRCFIASGYKDNSFWGMIILAVLALVDLVLYKMQLVADNSTFTRIGIFAYIGFLGVEIIRDYIKAYHLYLKSEMLSKAAYFDMLTDFYNRTSYIEDTKQISIDKKYGTIIVVFDMNNLKYINDIYGHSKGDSAIIESADFIKNEFGDIGKCYRIGGDEFIFITKTQDMPLEEINFRLSEMNKKLQARNQQLPELSPWPLLIASGAAAFSKQHKDVSEAFSIADAIMYNNKQQLKQQYPEMNLRK